ncbi:MAG: tellurite resistance TerB family protein [Enhydrobacter sp.]|nr:tellurite resistance TerB family protein [Enhydrobacter sp.]
MMLDAKRLLEQVLGGGQADGRGSGAGDFLRGGAAGAGDFLRGSGGGALAGGLAAILLGSKTGRQIGGEVLKLGGMAAVGALAYKAWNDWQAGKAPAPATETARTSTPLLPPPAGTPFNPVNEVGQQRLARHLLRAMIAAAKSDGHVDAQEQARIFGEMDKLNLSSEDKAFVMDELRSKLDIDAVADAASSPEEAAEIYAASLLAIDIDNAAERGYLGMLAARLKLDDALVAHLQQNVSAAVGNSPTVGAK